MEKTLRTLRRIRTQDTTDTRHAPTTGRTTVAGRPPIGRHARHASCASHAPPDSHAHQPVTRRPTVTRRPLAKRRPPITRRPPVTRNSQSRPARRNEETQNQRFGAWIVHIGKSCWRPKSARESVRQRSYNILKLATRKSAPPTCSDVWRGPAWPPLGPAVAPQLPHCVPAVAALCPRSVPIVTPCLRVHGVAPMWPRRGSAAAPP